VLTFTYRNFNGCVPEPGELDNQSQTLLKKSRDSLAEIGGLLNGCHFREAIRAAMSMAQETNRYLDDKSPWKVIKEDKQAAANSLYAAMYVISCLKTALYPFIPFSSQKVHEYLGFEGKVEGYGWQPAVPEPGQKLITPQPLFKKLDKSIVEEETARLGNV
jgi:methionyl-tRNA synthetase